MPNTIPPTNGNVIDWRLKDLEAFKREIMQEFRALKSAVHEVHTATMVSNENKCPIPGKCLELEYRIEDFTRWSDGITAWKTAIDRKIHIALGGVVVITPVATYALPHLMQFWGVG